MSNTSYVRRRPRNGVHQLLQQAEGAGGREVEIIRDRIPESAAQIVQRRPEPSRRSRLRSPPSRRRSPSPILVFEEIVSGLDYDDVQCREEVAILHVDPTAPQDTTVHLQLDLIPDVESELERFSRLQRLGHVHAAREVFKQSLQQCLTTPYILVQYAQFLLNSADYQSLSELSKRWEGVELPMAAGCLWYMILAKAQAESDYTMCLPESIPSVAHVYIAAGKIFRLHLQIGSIDSTDAELGIATMNEWNFGLHQGLGKHHIGKNGFYTLLRCSGLIWEFRDFLDASLHEIGLEKTINTIFPETSPHAVVDWIERDWVQDSEDETTSFALLDIFSLLVFASMIACEEMVARHTVYLRAAQKYASSLCRRSPDHARTRPYFLWSLAKVQLDCIRSGHGWRKFKDHIESGGGHVHRSADGSAGLPVRSVPVYMPEDEETPTWPSNRESKATEPYKSATMTLLRASEELGDVNLQAACLVQLILLSHKPEACVHLGRLESLWWLSKNFKQLRLIVLFKYVLADDALTRQKLRDEILSSEEFRYFPVCNGIRSKVLSNLSTSEEDRAHHAIQSRAFFDSVSSKQEASLDELEERQFSRVRDSEVLESDTCDKGGTETNDDDGVASNVEHAVDKKVELSDSSTIKTRVPAPRTLKQPQHSTPAKSGQSQAGLSTKSRCEAENMTDGDKGPLRRRTTVEMESENERQ